MSIKDITLISPTFETFPQLLNLPDAQATSNALNRALTMMKLEKVEDPGEALVTPPPIKKPKMADRVSAHLDVTPAPVVGPQTVKCYNLATCCFRIC